MCIKNIKKKKMYNPKVKILKFTLNRKIYREFVEFVFRKETVGS